MVLTPEHGVATTQRQVVSIWTLIKDSNYLFAAITGGWAYFLYDYLGPILSVRLVEMGCDQKQAAMFF
jgi:hypothetical protein